MTPIILDIENNCSNTQGCIDRDLKKVGGKKSRKEERNQ